MEQTPEIKNENKDSEIYNRIANNEEIEENDENLNEDKYLDETEISRSTIKNVYGNKYDQILREFNNIFVPNQ